MEGCFRRQIVLQIEQVFERPSGCRLFQLFGDVMPETLFAVRSDSETYGMQRSVERQVNTSYPVFPHIRYIFIAAGKHAVSHPAMTLCIPSGISRSECCIPCEEYPLRFHGPAAARHRTRSRASIAGFPYAPGRNPGVSTPPRRRTPGVRNDAARRRPQMRHTRFPRYTTALRDCDCLTISVSD